MRIQDSTASSGYRKIEFIAEVKPYSPAEGERTKSWDELLEEVISSRCDKISIHTHKLFRGGFDLVRRASELTSIPILAKGFHFQNDDIKRALDAGATNVLVVGRIPEVAIERCFVEPLTPEELPLIPQEAAMAVWNARDLVGMLQKVGARDILADLARVRNNGSPNRAFPQEIIQRPSFDTVRTLYAGRLCQASRLKTVSDIALGADAILVGSNMKGFIASMTT